VEFNQSSSHSLVCYPVTGYGFDGYDLKVDFPCFFAAKFLQARNRHGNSSQSKEQKAHESHKRE
jgi:hypothetical protein